MGGDKGEGVLSRLILYHKLRSASVIFFPKHRARSERDKTEDIDYHPLLSPPPLRGREQKRETPASRAEYFHGNSNQFPSQCPFYRNSV